MKLLADRDERFRGLLIKVVIFLLLALAGLAINLAFSGIKKGLFSPKTSIYFIAENGQDIKEGMPVKLSGFKIGAVEYIELDNMARARVEMRIENDYLPLLGANTVIILKKENIFGDSILEARRKAQSRERLAAGATIPFERGSSLDRVIEDLHARLLPAMDNANNLLRDINDPQGDVRLLIKNLHMLSTELRGTRQRLDAVLGRLDEGVANDLRPALLSIKRAADNVEGMTGKLDKEIPQVVSKVGSTLDSLRETNEAIRSATESTIPKFSGLLNESQAIVNDSKDILNEARNIEESLTTSWPLKNIVPQPERGVLKMDSHD